MSTEHCYAEAEARGPDADRPARVLIGSCAEAAGRLGRALLLRGYDVRHVRDGGAALRAVAEEPPDALLVEAGLPGVSGLEVARRLRAAGDPTPVIVLSAHSEAARIAAFESGASDCLPDFITEAELVVRLEARMRRARPADSPLSAGPLRVDRDSHEVWVGPLRVELTLKEFDLLSLLLCHRGRVLSRDAIFDLIWDYNYGADSNVIEVHVSALRRKLAAAGCPPCIRTVRGVGYALRL